MTYRYAKQLHNGDQITVKETGEVTTVISTEITDKDVTVYAMTSDNGYSALHHKQIS